MASDTDPLPLARPVVRRPQPNFWWSLLACVGLLVVQFAVLLPVWAVVWMVACYTAEGDPQQNLRADMGELQKLSAPPPPDAPPTVMPPRLGLSIVVATAAANLGMLLYTWLLLRLVIGRRWPRAVALRRPGAAQLLVAVLVFLPGLVFTHEGVHVLLGWLFNAPPGDAARLVVAASDASPVWLSVLAIAVGPGLVEELFCRGFVGRGLVGRRGWAVGVLLTSALFGLLHLEPLYALGTFVMGVGLHYSLAASRSLWVPVILHTLNNALSVLGSSLPITAEPPTPGLLALRYGSAVALVLLGGWALWSCRAKLKPVGGDPSDWRPRFPGVEVPPPGGGVVVTHDRPHPLPTLLALLPLGGLAYTLWPAN